VATPNGFPFGKYNDPKIGGCFEPEKSKVYHRNVHARLVYLQPWVTLKAGPVNKVTLTLTPTVLPSSDPNPDPGETVWRGR